MYNNRMILYPYLYQFRGSFISFSFNNESWRLHLLAELFQSILQNKLLVPSNLSSLDSRVHYVKFMSIIMYILPLN